MALRVRLSGHAQQAQPQRPPDSSAVPGSQDQGELLQQQEKAEHINSPCPLPDKEGFTSRAVPQGDSLLFFHPIEQK